MSMTGAELLTYIKKTFKRTDKDTELYEAITETIMDIKIAFNPEQFKTIGYTAGIDTIGEYSFTLPTNFGHLIGDIKILDGTSSYALEKLSKSSYDRLEANPSYSGVDTSKPTHFCIYGGQVFLYPVPDSLDYQYELNYTEEDATEVTAVTAVVDFTDRHRDTLKYGVLSRMYIDLGIDDEAMKFTNLYNQSLGKIITNDEDNIAASGSVKYNDL